MLGATRGHSAAREVGTAQCFMTRFWEHLSHVLWGRASRHEKLPDVRELPTRSVAVSGTQYLVHDRERHGPGTRLYVLRVRRDSRDRGRIRVFSNGRLLGRLSGEVSSALAPSLEQVGGAAVVNGSGTKAGGIRLWVDVPTSRAFSEFAEARSREPSSDNAVAGFPDGARRRG